MTDNRISSPRMGLELSDVEFIQLSNMVERRTGLRFPDDKRNEFQIKLHDCFPDSAGQSGYEIIRKVQASEAAFQTLINRITIGESYFFRNQPHFNALRERILPDLIRRSRARESLRIWCAGCACGEEPYSLAVMLREDFSHIADWNVSIIATDINTDFLERARQGVYRKWSFRGVEQRLIDKYFTPVDAHRYRLDDAVKGAVHFKPFNLIKRPYGDSFAEAPFDLVICRNVLIYFSFERANEIIESFADVTAPGSYLLVGHSEAFPALSQLDAIYSNATYYYQYYMVAGERADKHSIAPGPSLSIPGIGVKTIVSKAPGPVDPAEEPETTVRPLAVPGLPVAEHPADIDRVHWRQRAKSITPPIEGSPEAAYYDADDGLDHARRQVNEGRVPEALENLGKLAAEEGKLDHRVHFLRAIVADQARQAGLAVKSLKQSIFLKKDFVIGHFFLGVVCQREGLTKEAERAYRNVDTLLVGLPDFHLLEDSEGMTAGRLREISAARLDDIRLDLA